MRGTNLITDVEAEEGAPPATTAADVEVLAVDVALAEEAADEDLFVAATEEAEELALEDRVDVALAADEDAPGTVTPQRDS
jgi:hypothetical protein